MATLTNMPDTKQTRLHRWMAGETPGPWEVTVMPTNRCNLKCEICWERLAEIGIGLSIYDKSQELPDTRLLELVDECAELGVREWTIVGAGEPMIRADLVMEMCERVKGHNMLGVLHTNGTRFKREHLEHLVYIGWDRVEVSLDGPNAEINDHIRAGNQCFDKATASMRLLGEIKAKKGVDLPKVFLSSVLTNTNLDKLCDIVEMAYGLGCAGVGASVLLPQGDACAVFALDESQQAQVYTLAKEAIRRSQSLGMLHNFEDLLTPEERGQTASEKLNMGCALDGANCYEPWMSAHVHVGGNVGPCCVSWEDHADNVAETSFRDVWLGPYMTSARERIVTPKLLPYCESCPSYIAPRTEALNDALDSYAYWKSYTEMNLRQRAGYLAGRLVGGLRGEGVRGTMLKMRDWRAGRKDWAETRR